MTGAETVELLLAGNWVTHAVEQQSTAISLQTGRELLVGCVRFDVRGRAANDEVRRALGAAASGTEHVRGRWREQDREFQVGEWSYSTTAATTDVASFSVQLKEAENVKADRLTIGDLELRPYAYKERLEDGGIGIDCRVELDADASKRLEDVLEAKREGQYFSVVRHGVEDAPRDMRFGQCTWSRSGEKVKHRLTLVERAMDEREPKPAIGGLFQPMLANAVRRVALAEGFNAALLDELIAGGAINQQAAERIRKRAQDDYWRNLRALFEERDVDEFE